MRSKFSHLSKDKREVIHNLLISGKKQKEIAQAIGVHPSTICRELKANYQNGKYDPAQAHKRYTNNRKFCFYQKPWSKEIFVHVKNNLKKKLSPASIAGRTNFSTNPEYKVSHQTIYNWVRKGILGTGMQKLLLYGKKGYNKRANIPKASKNKKRIDKMPEEAKNPTVVGHYQGDTVHGKNQSGAMATVVDVFSKFIFARIMKDKTANSYSEALRDIFSEVDNEKLKTLLEDNGSEMSNFESDEEMLGCDIYFSYPGRPWEKALIENSNRMLRRFFPKKMSFENVTQENILQAVEHLNNIPRKSLGWKTAYEVFYNVEKIAFELLI